MGLLSKIVDLIPGESKIEGFLETAADVVEGVVDGALVFTGPVGWAILGAKTAANVGWAALDGNPQTSAMGALGESVLSAGLGAVGGGVLKGVLPKVADAGSGLAGRSAAFAQRALSGADDLAQSMASKVDDVMINSRYSSQWGNLVDEGSRLSRVTDAGAAMATRASEGVVNFGRLTSQYASRFVQAGDEAAASGFRRYLSPRNMMIAGGVTLATQGMGGGAAAAPSPAGGEGSAGLGAGNTEADIAMRAAFGVKEP